MATTRGNGLSSSPRLFCQFAEVTRFLQALNVKMYVFEHQYSQAV